MTTAHRPTFVPARGGTGKNEGDLSKLSQQYSSKDMPSHTKLKYRQKGQSHADDIRGKDLRRELEEKERVASRDRRSREGYSGSSAGNSSSKKPRMEAVTHATLDEDDPYDDYDEDDDDSGEEDTAELMAELARIRKERALEKAQRDAAEAEEQERVRTENLLHGNPLLNNDSTDFRVKRRWDDDVVFKNCAKGLEERKKEPTFINDAIRSEFHKKFMEKYIK
uniref:Protein CWC15 homolog n=1 Tax=Syphacia muris TaxID=451379 RepID=A0A0N5AWK2_9BILA